MLTHDRTRPLKVFTSPKYTVNADKELCPSLIKLGEQVEFVKDIVLWLTYRHRRNSILGDSGKGFITAVRQNGRIGTPANSCGAATSRYKHSVVCNIPRVSSVYGKEIRSLFCCEEENYQVGYDFSGLEARIEGHYTKQFEGGEAYAELLVAEKPNDVHTVMAKLNIISRDEQKSLKYGLTYGAQIPKVAAMFGWSVNKAGNVFDSFWENASPLRDLKERVVSYWKIKGGKKFIKALDGRKLWVRSEHSILNMLFQSAGVICAKKANEFHWKELKKEGFLFDPFKDDSFQGKCFIQIHYHDEAQWEVSKELVEFLQFDTKEEAESYSEARVLGDVVQKGNRFVRAYSVVGDIAAKAAKKAGDYYNLRVNLNADYVIGKNWAECH
jgi:DNA polymerase I-like protein with 3'-5' exonuclease and polymerase domains